MFFLTIIFVLLIFSSIIMHGFLLGKLINVNNSTYVDCFIYGILNIIFLSLMINFFLPLNIYLTNIFFYITAFLGLFLIIFRIKKYIELFFIISFAAIITYKSFPYNDYYLYHLPYIEILKNFKIVFGLSNLEWRFGHSSILQNISAFLSNNLMKNDSYVFLTPLIVSLVLLETFMIFLKSNNKLIITLTFVFISFYLIHANRYGAIGNDYPSHALAFLAFVYFLDLFNEKNKKDKSKVFYLILSLIVICFFSKLSFIFLSLIILFILIKKHYYIKIKISLIIFIISLIFIFFIKNIINSSCFIFPIFSTCIQTEWLPNEYSENSAKYVSVVSEAAVKDYDNSGLFGPSDSLTIFDKKYMEKNKHIYLKLNSPQREVFNRIKRDTWYNQLYIWTPIYFKNYFKQKILKELLLHLLVIIFFNFLIFLYFKSKLKKKSIKIFLNYQNNVLFILNIIFVIFWFLNFPLIRYGITFLLVFISLPIYMQLILFDINFERLKRPYLIFLFLIFSYSFVENINRYIFFDQKENITKNIVPLEIYPSYDKKIDNINFSVADSVCGFNLPPCIYSGSLNRFEREFKIKKNKGYLFIMNKNNKVL